MQEDTMECPDDSALQNFAEGRMSEAKTSVLRQHLRSCSSCREVLAVTSSAAESPLFFGVRKPWGHVGQLLAGRFFLQERIGLGAMGVVWRGEDRERQCPVAIKLLNIPDPELKKRFRRESQILERLEHKNIVRVVAVRAEDDAEVASIAMELLEGETLQQTLDRDVRLSEASAIALAECVLMGLEHAHAAGVLHRDLKPQNIFLHREHGALVPKIIDFGLAKAAAEWNLSAVTRSGVVVGTPRYMAPEQIFNDPVIDGRADIWALGVVLYRALSGAFPHEGRTLGEVVRAFAERKLVPIGARVSLVADSLASLIDGMLAIDANKRVPSAKLALEQLRSAAGHCSLSPPVV
jgi:eukaryotic-like serine/threonine-protein kinase